MKQHLNLPDLIEECLTQLQHGAGLEDILLRYPQQAAELRPLLEAAVLVYLPLTPEPVSSAAQYRSRTQLLATARLMHPPARVPAFSFAKVAAIVTVVVLFFATGFAVTSASAYALPGDFLYPVKRTVEKVQLALTNDPLDYLLLEEEFDQERAEEILGMIADGREGEMQFGGFLVEHPNGKWTVGDVTLKLMPEQALMARTLKGNYVDVIAVVTGDGVAVELIELRLRQITGILEEVQDGAWIVNGLTILFNENTEIAGELQVGKTVTVTVMIFDDGGAEAYLALRARMGNAGKPDQVDKEKTPPGLEKKLETEKTPPGLEDKDKDVPPGQLKKTVTPTEKVKDKEDKDKDLPDVVLTVVPDKDD